MAASVTTLITSAQILKAAGLDVYNKANSLIGQLNSLQSSLNAGTAFAVAPDIVEYDSRLKNLIIDVQTLNTAIDKARTDLTMPA